MYQSRPTLIQRGNPCNLVEYHNVKTQNEATWFNRWSPWLSHKSNKMKLYGWNPLSEENAGLSHAPRFSYKGYPAWHSYLQLAETSVSIWHSAINRRNFVFLSPSFHNLAANQKHGLPRDLDFNHGLWVMFSSVCNGPPMETSDTYLAPNGNVWYLDLDWGVKIDQLKDQIRPCSLCFLVGLDLKTRSPQKVNSIIQFN